MPSKGRPKSVTQLKMKFWKRDTGALWLPFERKKITEFTKVKPHQKISISGYVKWISRWTFALVPTLFSNQIHLICKNYTDDRPPENSYITVSGIAKFDKLRPKTYRPHSNYYEGNLGWKRIRQKKYLSITNKIINLITLFFHLHL